jgi:hypothetical protein
MPKMEKSRVKSVLGICLAVVVLAVLAWPVIAGITNFDQLQVRKHDSSGTYYYVPAVTDGSASDDWVVNVGTDDNGTETFSVTYSAAPVVVATILHNLDVATGNYSCYLKTISTTGFTYEVRADSTDGSGIQDVTASVPVQWQATGYLP